MTENPAALTLSVSIERPFDEVYDYLAEPGNFPAWASGLGEALEPDGDAWIARTPDGPLTVRFSPRNRFGVLDHWVRLDAATEIYIPMRAVAGGAGTELIFTLFRRPGMSGERFGEDAEWVQRDLLALKTLLEN